MRRLEAVGHLAGSEGEHLGVGIGRRARLIARVGEQVGGAPQQLHTGSLLMLGGDVDHLVEIDRRLFEAGALGCDVAVVEAVERHAELGEELEGGVHLLLRRDHRVGAGSERRVPRSIHRAGTEDVEAVPGERVPVAHGEAEVILHSPAGNDPVGVVPAKGQWVVAVGTLVSNAVGDVGEELHNAGSYCTAAPKKMVAESFTSRSRVMMPSS